MHEITFYFKFRKEITNFNIEKNSKNNKINEIVDYNFTTGVPVR